MPTDPARSVKCGRAKETATEWTGRGRGFAGRRRYDDAIACDVRAIALEPEEAVARNNRRLARSCL